MGKVALYLRVSSEEQTTENQIPALRSWVETHGHEIAEVYQENESAWRSGHQHELARLLSDIRGGHRRVVFQLAEVTVSRDLFAAILGQISKLCPSPGYVQQMRYRQSDEGDRGKCRSFPMESLAGADR